MRTLREKEKEFEEIIVGIFKNIALFENHILNETNDKSYLTKIANEIH